MLQRSLLITRFLVVLVIYSCSVTNVPSKEMVVVDAPIEKKLITNECPLQEGDIIFIKSQTKQSELIRIVAGSEWTHVGMAFREASGFKILEAVQPVKWTNLLSFLERSKGLAFDVKRPVFNFNAKELKAEALKDLNKNYDLIFNWDDSSIYCSEFVWKSYFRTSFVEIGRLQKNKEFPSADDYKVQNELLNRYKKLGIPFDREKWLEEVVITPVEMMRSPLIETVYTKVDLPLLKSCLNK